MTVYNSKKERPRRKVGERRVRVAPLMRRVYELHVIKRQEQKRVYVFFSGYGNNYSSGPPRFGGSRGGPPAGKKFGSPGDRLRKKHWNLDELPKFEKNFYQEHPDIAHRSSVRKQSV